MVFDFSKLNTPEWKEKQRLAKEQMQREQELMNQTCCFTGHRPDKLGGYDMKNPTMLKLRDKLLEWIEILIKDEGVKRFISGGALGTDTCAFWCVHKVKEKYPDVKNVVAIPFKNQDKVWTPEQKYWYQKMLQLADEIINIEELPKYKSNNDASFGEFSGKKMQKRNEYMVDQSSKMIAVYDGSKTGGTANCVRYAHYNKRGNGMMLVQIMPQYDFEVNTKWIY